MRRFSLCGYILSTTGLRRACVNVVGEHVRSITSTPAYEVDVRCSDCIIAPAAVDMHVHLRGLGLSYKETVYSGTRAAAAGGVAVVVDMPNTVPYLNTLENVKLRLEELKDEAVIDFTRYAGIPDTRDEVEKIAGLPIAGFKVYPENIVSETTCWALKAAEKYGKIVVVHAEHPWGLSIEAGWDRSVYRPCWVEQAAVYEIAGLAERCGARPRIHITHVSCPSTVDAARKYGFTVDTTPHHLLLPLLGVDALEACKVKVNPPIRGINEASKLLHLLLHGSIDAIASDHAPHAEWEKAMHPYLCPPGIAGLEHWPGAVMLLAVQAKAYHVYTVASARAPASLLSLKGRGCLEPGCVADIVVASLQPVRSVDLFSNYLTPYMLLHVEKLATRSLYIRGVRVYSDEEGLLVDKGFGVNATTYKLS